MRTIQPILIAITLALTACASVAPNSKGLYGPSPVRQQVAGSSDQRNIHRYYQQDLDTSAQAIKQTIAAIGFTLDESDDSNGKYTAHGILNTASDGGWPYTLAFYVKQISSTPTTEIHLFVDSHRTSIGGTPSRPAARAIMDELERRLKPQ